VAATKISTINSALRLLKTRKLTDAELAGNLREPARIANDIFDADFVRGCLEAGAWRFALRSQQIFASPSITPDFGFEFAFEKGTDWLRTVGVYDQGDMNQPWSDYRDEATVIYTSIDTLFVTYVSSDVDFGADFAKWPRSFQEFVEAKLASLMAGPMTQEGQEMMSLSDLYLKRAIGKDVINEPARRQQPGTWVRARIAGAWDNKQPGRWW
jgi:hypothetical protein